MTMPLSDDYQIILCTCPTTEVAKKIATHLVESNLAACVNILPEITSIYRWENKTEVQPYDTPEIIAIPIQDGHPKYLQWLDMALLSQKP
jgi:periplasmic divalent cation tolerance protein